MKTRFLKYIGLVGIAGILFSCEKDEDKLFLREDAVAPQIVTMPGMTLSRDNGTQTLSFICSPLDAGFKASARYFLEADAVGNNFADPVIIYNGFSIEKVDIVVSDLNALLLRKFTEDVASSAEFRVRAVLTVDAGTGAPGTGSNPFEYVSDVKTATVTPYGLPRLDLIASGMDQKIESALGDGVYFGIVKLSTANPFTLLDPEANTEYGAAGSSTIEEDGPAITVETSGYYKLTVDVNALTYTLDPYMLGVVGSATPNGWDGPDIMFDYDKKTDTWYVTTDLATGEIKFRLNNKWDWNLGGALDGLTQGGDNIAVEAGNYTITLTVTGDTGRAVIKKN